MVTRKKRDAELDLLRHSWRSAWVFIGIILIAVAIDQFNKLLVRFGAFGTDSNFYWAIRFAAFALVGIDILALLGVVGKAALKRVKES